MKLFSLFILSLCSVMGFSQTILYQTENTTRTVQDPQTVVLAQGFQATGSVSNPFIGKIGPATENPGGGPIDSNAGVTNPSGTYAPAGKSFHDTKGSIEVNGGGQLKFTLPIALPPGVKSIAPQIDLVYTSDSGNGIAGYGWNLSGLSSISRIGKNIEKDGEVQSIQIDYSDFYSFNGQRLILKSGEYGKDGAEYITEKYSNIKIKSLGNIPNWKQPEYWEVTFEDGSQAWYGRNTPSSDNAVNRLGFSIVKWKDAQGNIINYTYDQDSNVNTLKSITWGGNENLGTISFNEILFSYDERSFPERTYINGPGTLFVQTKILRDITVKTNGQVFKKYVPEYVVDSVGYQYVKKITESNSAGESANPIEFNYPAQNQASISGWNLDSQALFDNVKFSGDFNGDAYLDFVMNDGTMKLGVFNDDFNVVQTNKIFNSNSIVVNSFLDETGKVNNGNGIAEYDNGVLSVFVFRNNTFVKIFEKTIVDIICPSCDVSLNEGDINGDGISDIFLIPKTGAPYDFDIRYVIDLKNSQTPFSIWLLDPQINENLYTEQKYMDIDGDGKVDIINVSDTAYTIFEFVPYGPNQYLKRIKFSGNLENVRGAGFPVLFGDFNGDGKLDFTLPVTEGKIGKDDWKFYIGTGKSFTSVFKPDFLMFKNENTQNNNGAWLRFSRTMYSISDLNADGKSDIVQVHSYSNLLTSNSRTIGVVVNGLVSTGGDVFGNVDFQTQNIYTYPTPPQFNIVQPYDDVSIYQPITNVIRSNNNYYNVFLFRKNNVLKIKAPTGVNELKRIQSITQGGITTSVKYSEIVPDNTITPNFYKNTKSELYPYFSLNRMDRAYAVSQLQNQGRKQDFRYRGMTIHMQGKGSIGYYQMARSTWFADGMENTKIWSGVEIDPQKFGQLAKEWSIRTNEENLIFPTDLSINNTQLLSIKQNNYSVQQLSNKVDVILPETIVEKDFLRNIVSTKTITYGDYYLPLSTLTTVNNNYSILTTTLEYTHNASGVGADYFIGRLKSKTSLSQTYNDSKSGKEEYTYENNLLKTLKIWNLDNTNYLLETYFHDGFGNVTQKIISNSTDSQTQISKTEYEPKGMFVQKMTDNLQSETNITYNDLGQILTQTDPLGNILTNTYDVWGKLMTAKSNLKGTTTYQYTRDDNGNIGIIQYEPSGDISRKYTNKLGQEYKVQTKSFGENKYIAKYKLYDTLGRKVRETEPYFDEATEELPAGIIWNAISYDDTVYPSKITTTALAKFNPQGVMTSFEGKKMTTFLNGNVTIATELNGYGRTTSKTTDALGNVTASTDSGGTVTFTYNASGEQIKAQYAENIVTTKYDTWGRKAEFNDPSNGTYKYEYDGFGQIKKIISPKGTKEFIYNNFGQVITQKELSTLDGGQATNKIITFTYDNKGRIIAKGGQSNGKPYNSSFLYDSQGRLLSSSENSNGKYFIQKGISYDDKGRVISYEKSLYSSGMMTKVNIENIYSAWNGELYQIKDKISGKILWQLNQTNARGQVLSALLGSSIISNNFNANGSLTNITHSSQSNQGILQILYSFDVIKNELKSRTRGADFNIVELFDYDDNNRLVNWTDPVTGIKPSANRNIYDSKGRILENDQVGTMKYENSAKVYQPTGMTLNTAGEQNYNNDLIQSIVYNENNDPVFIDGIKGDVAFQYGLTNMRQRVTYGGNFAADGNGIFTKFYNGDGSFEIQVNNATGAEKHVLYIGGTPYESNIAFIKNYGEASGSYKFLHKDYLGSILAITDENGNKLEQRHFDAWGNMTHYKKGNLATFIDRDQINLIIANGDLVLDRGYTSHEYFPEVGIIHMNGRLYDPLLRRFLNADEYIQDPTNTQSYNKYGYVLNNPLMFNDFNGEWFGLDDLIVAASSFVIGYVSHGLTQGNWGWDAVKSGLQLAAMAWIGYNTAGIATAGQGVLSGSAGTSMWNFIANTAINAAISAVIPPLNLSVGNFDFSISPSVAIGKGWGFGANLSTTFHAGRMSISGGFGIMNYGGHAGSGLKGWEYRKSLMVNYTSKDFNFSVGTNIWNGLHSQQTGILGLGTRSLFLTYENDGAPFAKIKNSEGILVDNNDRWRTAAMRISVGRFQAGFNLFTGERYSSSYAENGGADSETMANYPVPPDFFKRVFNTVPDGTDGGYGAKHPLGNVEEVGPRYRLGAAYIGWGNYRIGIDSDRYIRHAIQDIGAHYYAFPQPGFEVLSSGVSPYFQYQTVNNFTSW